VVRGLQRHLERRRDVLVVNWQAPMAAPYFEASHEAPLNVRFRRSFQCDGNKILSFDDVVFLELAAEVARLLAEPEMDDALYPSLHEPRTGEMQDIVKAIQAAQ
jgi:DNA helicase IV